MGKAVLASQFAAGLLPEIKAKVAGSKGDVDTLLAMARFEEAKLRDFAVSKHQLKKPTPSIPTSRQVGKVGNTPERQSAALGGQKTSVQCYGCGSCGHYRNMCPARNKGGPTETPGKDQRGKGGRGSVAKLALVGPGAKEHQEEDDGVEKALETPCIPSPRMLKRAAWSWVLFLRLGWR